MDLLYFEYLKQRLSNGEIGQLYVAPWSGAIGQDGRSAAEAELSANLERIFGMVRNRVRVLFASDLAPLSVDLLAEDFLIQLESLGDSGFLRESSRTMGYKFKSYHDINSGHPESVQARAIVEHSIRGWLLYRYLVTEAEAGTIQLENSPAIGALMWERELAKLLLLRNIGAHFPNARLGLMLGRSITFREGAVKRRPLPTYLGGETINVFGDLETLERQCSEKPARELAVASEVANAILEANRMPYASLAISQSHAQMYPGASNRPAPRYVDNAFHALHAVRDLYRLDI